MDSKKLSPGTFKCALCGDTFNTNKHLVNHKSVHANENRIFKCTKCQSTFTDHCEYLLHEVTHIHFRVEQKCIECGVFKKKISLPIHIMTHFEQRKQPCEFCNIVLPVDELKKHVRTHSILSTVVECEICLKKLSSWKYEAHVVSHAAEREFPCPFCGKVFKSKRSRNDHAKLHTGERMEICNICGLFFHTTESLKRHQRKHKTEMKYKCDYCEEEFFNRYAIEHHILRHMKGFKCTCEKCKFTAFTREEVVEHQKMVHFYCKICKKGFTNGQSLGKHLLSRSHKRMAVQKNLDVDY